MDVTAEFQHAIEQMEWGDVLDTLQAVVEDMLQGTTYSSPTTPSPPVLSAGLEYDIHPHPVGDVTEAYGGCSSQYLGIAPHRFTQPAMATQNNMQAGHLYCQEQAVWSAVDNHLWTSAAAYYPADPPYTYENAAVISFYECMGQTLDPPQLLNGEIPADRLHYSNSAAPPASTSKSKKRKYEKQQDDDQPYIKKPLNAFMLFMKDQRLTIVAEINIKDSAVVNSILGQRWTSLSKEERANYYKKAEEERLLHAKLNPGWSSSDNYGKKRKRQRHKAATAAEWSSTSQTIVEKLPHMETPVIAHDPSPLTFQFQLNDLFFFDSPGEHQPAHKSLDEHHSSLSALKDTGHSTFLNLQPLMH